MRAGQGRIRWTADLETSNHQICRIDREESPEQDKRVEQHQRMLSERGLPEFYVDDEVELLREAFLHLNQIDYKVKIPFVAHIKFGHVSNRRNLPIFLDFVKTYCILNYGARQVDEDGALIATREDYDNALKLFETVAVQQITKLNEKERQIAAVIKDRAPCDIREIMDEGLSHNYVYELIHGKHNSGNKGLLEKIPELLLYPKNEFNPDTGARWGRNHYSLPKDWEVIDNSQSIVYWEDDDPDELRSGSHSFGDELRNSERGGEGLDSRLDKVSSDFKQSTNTNFATSEEHETNKPTYPASFASAPQRSSETEFLESADGLTNCLESDLDPQKGISLVSEKASETERNHTDANSSAISSRFKAEKNAAVSGEDLLKGQPDLAVTDVPQGTPAEKIEIRRHWAPKTVYPRKIPSGKWVTYVEIKVLSDILTFVGDDGKSYELVTGNVRLVPESNAKVLWEQELADFTEKWEVDSAMQTLDSSSLSEGRCSQTRRHSASESPPARYSSRSITFLVSLLCCFV